jgi:hypothetical protein
MPRFVHAGSGWALLLVCCAAAIHLSSAPSPTIRFVPEELGNPKWMSALRAMQPIQSGALAAVPVFHDFQFTDRRQDSGITFRNQIVDDAAKTYKAAHYDHGNGNAQFLRASIMIVAPWPVIDSSIVMGCAHRTKNMYER